MGILLPVSLSFAGITDANGNYTSPPLRPNPTLWAALRVVGQVAGNPRWTISIAGTPKAFARGPAVDPAVFLQPSQNLVITITGAQTLSQVVGSLEGVAGPTFEDISPFVSITPNAISLDTSTPANILDRIDTAPGSGNRVYAVPSGTVTVGFAIDADVVPPPPGVVNRGVIPSQIVLRGYPSGFNYILATSTQLALNGLIFAILDPHDTLISIAWTIVAGATNDFIDVLTSPADLAKQLDVQGDLLVSLQNATPALWQAPTAGTEGGTGSLAAGGNLTLVPAPPAGQNSYLHGLTVEFGSGVAGVSLSIQTLSSINLGLRLDGTFVHTIWHDFHGRNIFANGAQIHNNGAVGSGTINFGIDYAQG